MTGSKVSRWLDLLAYLLHHRYPVTRDQIFESVSGYRAERASERAKESARRKFIRDKEELDRLGIKIDTVKLASAAGDEPTDAYRLAPRDFYLPYLELVTNPEPRHRPYPSVRQVRVTRDDVRRLDEATAKLASHPTFPLAAAAASARRKLGFDLPLSTRAIERILAPRLEKDAATVLATLQRAVAERTAVTCVYWAIGRDQEEPRTIDPLGLFFQWSRWYCVARDRGRQGLRVFRVDRMRSAEFLDDADARFTPPEGFNIRAYVGRAPWELAETAPVRVRARLAFPESRWVMAQGFGIIVDPVLEDGGAILDFSVRDAGPFLRWALTMGRHLDVLAPESMVGELDALRKRVEALYAGSP